MFKAQYCQLTQKVKRVLSKVLREDLRQLVESWGLWAGCHLDHSSCLHDEVSTSQTSLPISLYVVLTNVHLFLKSRAKLMKPSLKSTFKILIVHLNYQSPPQTDVILSKLMFWPPLKKVNIYFKYLDHNI